MRTIDLRSDTVTRPTEGMRRAMAEAVVGDDVFEEDPTVRALEERVADLLGKEAGLFVASGTMGNLVALLTHAGRGDEIIAGHLGHTFLYEVGGTASLGSIHPAILQNRPDGTLDPLDVQRAIRSRDDIHVPRTRLVCLENTHNRCGGIALSAEYTRSIAAIAHANGVAVHLDGARLLNAARALRLKASVLAEPADTVTLCLSKGLGAPIGSVLCGARPFIREARRTRKMVGGGMRQVGVLAAAGLYALDHHVERLDEDHANANRLAAGIRGIRGLSTPQAEIPPTAWTNLVYLSVDPDLGIDARGLAERLAAAGVLAIPLGSDGRQMRMVTHLDVSSSDIEATLDALQSAVNGT
jgi:threonine aldolase